MTYYAFELYFNIYKIVNESIDMESRYYNLKNSSYNVR